ncbi:MAG: Na/Pi symporter [Planctomycetota bacterium]
MTDPRHLRWLARLILFGLALYVFLAAIELLGESIEIVGKGTAESLFNGLKDPFAGLAVGILATVLWQSSSATTSIVVVMVGSGELPLAYAVPMVMGANIGTSITNTIVALGHVRRNAEFRRAFAGATVHDMFNLLSVLVLFPLELATGFLRNTAQWLVAVLPLQGAGVEFKSPIKAAVKWPAGWIQSGFEDGLGLSGKLLAGVLFVVALGMLSGALVTITKNMRLVMADWIEQWLNRVLRRSGLLGLAIGAGITAAVQSSSITTSLLVPMFGAGVLALEAGFPIMLGANIGTTVTALLASTVTGPAGLTIAVVHLLFNLAGTALFFPLKFMRRIPIRLSQQLADLAIRNRIWVVIYIVGVFIVAPLLGILIWRG